MEAPGDSRKRKHKDDDEGILNLASCIQEVKLKRAKEEEENEKRKSDWEKQMEELRLHDRTVFNKVLQDLKAKKEKVEEEEKQKVEPVKLVKPVKMVKPVKFVKPVRFPLPPSIASANAVPN